MKTFQDINIQNLFPEWVYKRGVDYYNGGRVLDLSFDRNYEVWTAHVLGTERYFVEIGTQSFQQGSLETYCECPAFHAYQTCKHIAAVVFAIASHTRNTKNGILDYGYKSADYLIRALSSNTQEPMMPDILTEKQPIKMEYYCSLSYENTLKISLKAGVNRCYVVKEADEFIQNIMEGREHFFTKKFSYSPDAHYFLQQDMDILEMLKSIYQNEEIYQEYTFLYDRTRKDTRYVTIPPMLSERLLEKLSERDFEVKDGYETYKRIDVVHDAPPFSFLLTQNENDELLLHMQNMSGSTYLPIYDCLFSGGTFYFPEKDQSTVLNHVSALGMQDHVLPIKQSQSNMFLSEVLPSLKKIGELEVDTVVKSEIIQAPLRAKLYLDMTEGFVDGHLEYHYGSHRVDPFGDDSDDNKLIIRDTAKEQQIMHLIEYANFHYNGKRLYIEAENEEQLYDFLYKVLPVLEDHVELFLTGSIRNMIVENEPNPHTSVHVESSSNLLEIGFNIDGVDDDEINNIINAVIEKKRYYRLDSGAMMSLEGDEFTSINQFFSDLDIQKDDVENGQIKMPFYRGAQIDDMIETPKDYDPAFRKLLHQLKAPEEQVYPLPENLQASLRHYQETGFQWFKSLSAYHLGGILADDMGLGKTLQSIAYILSEKPSGDPHLIVVPSSVLYNWKNEFQKFAPDLKVGILTGTPKERRKKIGEWSYLDVWITSYATLRQDITLYRERTFQTLILDEAQFIKNYATKTSKAIREIKAGRRFALSGTPIENSIEELWAIFQVILPGLMPNQKTFKQMSHEKIANITKPFILRRLKEDVLKELPEKIESVSVSELTDNQKELYVGYLRQVQHEAKEGMEGSGFQKNRMKILAGLTRLRQICCHPSLFVENYTGQSGKLEQLMETVRTAVASGRRMLIFSQFTSMHEIIIQKLKDEGIDYFYLHGQTKSEERVDMSERFNDGEKNVFLISLKAGGTGLNLTGADTVILYDLWWNPAVEDQAADRAHRFGQKNVVQVIRLITEGTIEEKIYDLQQKKRELIDKVVQPGETMLSSLSEEDVRELLSI
ncbi:MAG TPA: DEAD/DEAH box helicase [Virgibacillus sp.]|nr:DEAD/DEAH box helicase [Virgibacillus sp.]